MVELIACQLKHYISTPEHSLQSEVHGNNTSSDQTGFIFITERGNHFHFNSASGKFLFTGDQLPFRVLTWGQEDPLPRLSLALPSFSPAVVQSTSHRG